MSRHWINGRTYSAADLSYGEVFLSDLTDESCWRSIAVLASPEQLKFLKRIKLEKSKNVKWINGWDFEWLISMQRGQTVNKQSLTSLSAWKRPLDAPTPASSWRMNEIIHTCAQERESQGEAVRPRIKKRSPNPSIEGCWLKIQSRSYFRVILSLFTDTSRSVLFRSKIILRLSLLIQAVSARVNRDFSRLDVCMFYSAHTFKNDNLNVTGSYHLASLTHFGQLGRDDQTRTKC